MDLKWIDGERIASSGPAKKEAIASVIAWAIEHIEDARGTCNVDGIWANSEGIAIDVFWEEYRRSCHVGTERLRVTIPWDEFLSDRPLHDCVKRAEERKAQEERERQAERRLADEKAREDRERAEYERLRAKYGPPAA